MEMLAACGWCDVLSDFVDGLAESYFEGRAFARKGTTSSRVDAFVRAESVRAGGLVVDVRRRAE